MSPTAGARKNDLLDVIGNATLFGSLLVALLPAEVGKNGALPPFLPLRGSSFDVLLATAILDEGFEIISPSLGDGNVSWHSSIVDVGERQALRLTLIPEPGTALLLLAGLIALSTRRWTRRATPL